ncbi:hypothetical protein NP493_653g01053 [Ridgeia piscesae]|uniref:Uncharacterized protein n=1 Tax=Ridgeia piscesae TaxID=27915 RepID=A0AAD9KSP3_RIDPI|nr:hypothetical protein NP493_653g01053 [Ridgeia piscesae]
MGMTYVFPTFQFTQLSSLYLGGVPAAVSYIFGRGDNFTGCLGHISWNDIPLQLMDATSGENIGDCTLPPSTTLPPPVPTTAPLTCDDLACDNGATCRMVVAPHDGEPTYRCDCPLHFRGQLCQEEISVYFPRFHGNSYLEHDLHDVDTTVTLDLYLSFKTTSNNGTLLFSEDEYSGFFYVFIKNGMVQLQLSCTRVNVLFIDTQTSVNNGSLTIVTIRLSVFPSTQQCDVSIQINSNTPINTSLSTSHKVAAPILRTLYVGGLPPGYLPLVAAMRSEHIDGFDGCMRHLQVNNDERLLFQDATRGQNIDDCDVPMCSFRPCLNNGTCLSDAVSWWCVCPAGVTGSLCERSACHYDPCQHGGTCLVTGDTYVCVCPYGRHGANCSQELTISRPSFRGNEFGYSSYLAYPRVKNMDFHMELRFSFSVLDNDLAPSGMVVYSGQRAGDPTDGADYVAVGVTGGHVIFQYNLGSGMIMIKSDRPLDMLTPVHSVHLGRYRQHGWLQVDGQRNMSGQTPGQLFGLNVFSDFYIGGHDTFDLDLLPRDLNFTSGFTGCIFDVTLRAGRYGRWSPLGKVLSGRNIQQCQRSECEVHSCYNGATCVEMGASFRCECPAGWTGQLCADRATACDSPLTNLCAPGSRCSPLTEGGYKCQCPLGKAGLNCHQNITISDASFKGEASYLGLVPPRNIRYSVALELQLKPTVESGLVLYMAEHLSVRTSDFLSLELYRGWIQLRYNTGSDQPTVIRSRQQLDINTDKWHHVAVGRNRTHGYVQVEGKRVTARAESGMVSLDTATLLYVGGLPDLSAVAVTAVEDEPVTFEGCVRGLIIDGRQYDLSETGAVEGLDVTDCDGTACGLDTCHNNATCQPEGSTYTCSCTEMFFGDTCQLSVYCRHHQCAGGATCVPDMERGSYSCDCPVGKMGRLCDSDVTFTAAQFTGEGFLHFTDTTQYNLSHTYISFELATVQRDGLILWNGQVLSQKDDFLAVGLRNGHLKVVVSLGGWTQTDLVTKHSINDGLWHSVTLQRVDQDLLVDIDSLVSRSRLPGDHHHLNTHGLLCVGGFEESNIKAQSNGHFDNAYIGCVRHLVVREHATPLDLLHPTGGVNVFSCDDKT